MENGVKFSCYFARLDGWSFLMASSVRIILVYCKFIATFILPHNLIGKKCSFRKIQLLLVTEAELSFAAANLSIRRIIDGIALLSIAI